MGLQNKIYSFFRCRYIDWLVTIFNEELPDEQWRIPQPHPSAVRPSTIEDADADYHRLVEQIYRQFGKAGVLAIIALPISTKSDKKSRPQITACHASAFDRILRPRTIVH